ncbi:MAG: GNAT family N-acetyltransferase [Nitrososphaerales archaeon]
MPDQITIRPLKDPDLDFIYRGIIELNWQDIPDEQKLHLSKSQSDEIARNEFSEQLRSGLNEGKNKLQIVVAELSPSKVLVGFLSFGEFIDRWSGLTIGAIFDLWVDPKFRKQGIGGKLIDHALSKIKESVIIYHLFKFHDKTKALSVCTKRKDFMKPISE